MNGGEDVEAGGEVVVEVMEVIGRMYGGGDSMTFRRVVMHVEVLLAVSQIRGVREIRERT